jgi:hypothetical protein
MKAEKEAEINRKREITKERKLKAAEKARLEEVAARMSAKKLQRFVLTQFRNTPLILI